MLGRGGGQVGFELGGQTPVAGQAEDVVDAVCLAPRHQIVAGEAAVGAQQNLDPWPGRAESINDAGHLGHSAR